MRRNPGLARGRARDRHPLTSLTSPWANRRLGNLSPALRLTLVLISGGLLLAIFAPANEPEDREGC